MYNFEALTKLRERVRKKMLEFWKKKSWILHKDNFSSYLPLRRLGMEHAIMQSTKSPPVFLEIY
jgi:hypothetical protein